MWWIHDYRLEIHHELKKKAQEYKMRQQEILEKTVKIHEERLAELRADGGSHDYDDESIGSSAGSDVMDSSEIDVDGVDVILEH